MHFVYKLDNLFRSMRVSDENTSITKGFQFFEHILTQDFFCIQYAPFKATSSLFKPFLTSFAIFHAFHDLFWAKMTLNWKALQMNLEMVESWHGIIISSTYHVLKSWEGYGKNWMHFVYKMDNLFRSIRVSYENSSVTKAFHFLKLIWTPDFLCIKYAPFEATPSIFNPFWLHLLFFMDLVIFFVLNDPEIGKHYKWTLKRLKVGMVSSFHPHSMC